MNYRQRSEEPLEEARFDWYVFDESLRWELDGQNMVMASPKGSARATRPLEDFPEMFDEFSRLDTPDEVLNFANRYGWLGLDRFNPFPSGSIGESFVEWRNEARNMRAGITIADLVHYKNERGLKKFVQWGSGEREGMVRLCCHFEDSGKVVGCGTTIPFDDLPSNSIQQQVVTRETGKRMLAIWRKGESLGPAEAFLSSLVDRQLYKQVSPRLVLDSEGSLKPYYYPSSLLAAMWLQFYRFVIGETRFRKCEICLKRMDVTENRSNKRVHKQCSNRVRMQKYRSGNG